MADVHTPEQRSYNMRRIKSKDTKPELIVRKYLFAPGFRYRLHVKSLPGTPDITLTKYRIAIFVHGCFWHGHDNCMHFVVPKTRTEFWLDKINTNKQRDQENVNRLLSLEWKVLTIFECELKQGKRYETLDKLLEKINGKLLY